MNLEPHIYKYQSQVSRVLLVLAYIAQVPSPPPNPKRIGVIAVMKSLRFWGNSLSYITSFNLHLVGGLRFPEPFAYLASCGMCAAHKSLVGSVDKHNELLGVACEELLLAEHRYKSCTPQGQDTPALCTNLFLFASHVCSELRDPGLPRFRNVQAFCTKCFVRECLSHFQFGAS